MCTNDSRGQGCTSDNEESMTGTKSLRNIHSLYQGRGGGEKNKTLVTTAKHNKIYAIVHTVLYNQETIDWG